MSYRSKQLSLLKAKKENRYGGELLNTRKGRSGPRFLTTRESMHFVLRSSLAKGEWSFYRHKVAIKNILSSFSRKYGVELKSTAVLGNHIHLHLRLTNRYTYRAFIRAITAAIMMATTGASKWNPWKLKQKFWDKRPWSRLVVGFKAALKLKDYIHINRLESWGYTRDQARFLIEWDRGARNTS